MHNTAYSVATLPRLALVSPFLIGVAASGILILASLAAFGAATAVGYPAWAPPAAGLIFSLPSLVANGFFARFVWSVTRNGFRVQLLRLAVGCLPILATVGITIAYALLVDDPSSYRGQFNAVTNTYDPMYALKGFFSITVLIAVVFPGAMLALAKVLYLDAITPVGLSTPAGRDPIGEILRDASAQP